VGIRLVLLLKNLKKCIPTPLANALMG
jgi:hypothetical protein